MVYRFREGFHLLGDAQQVGEALEAIRQDEGGRLLPDVVVKVAKKPRSILHDFFEWDDTEAARQYRLTQAYYLIRAVVLCPEDGADGDEYFTPVRAFVCIDEPKDERKVFTHICDAMRDESLREQVLERAKRELTIWRRRYAHLREFSAVFAATDFVLTR